MVSSAQTFSGGVVRQLAARCRWAPLVLIALTIVGGCGTANHYQVSIEPTTEGFVRRVEVSTQPQPESPEGGPPVVLSERERLVFEAVYGKGQPVGDALRFERAFTEQTPADIGGNGDVGGDGSSNGDGALVRMTSELGEVFAYQERFRGGLPTQQQRLARQAAIDRLIQWTSGWLEQELAATEGAEAVKRFVEHDLRKDLQDLVCLVEVAGAQPESSESTSDGAVTLLLIGHFGVERGYLSVGELTRLPLLELSEDAGLRWAASRLRQKIATSTGLALDAPALRLLDHPTELPQRFERFLAETDGYRQWRDQRERDLAANRRDPQADNRQPKTGVSDYAAETLAPVLDPLIIGVLDWKVRDRLTLVLNTGSEPIDTNGTWDAAAGQVRWQWPLEDRLGPQADDRQHFQRLPQVAFALWAQPDVEQQTAIFGKVLLRDRPLRNYCRWRASLSDEQAGRWTALLERLPQLPLRGRSEALRQFDPAWSNRDQLPSVIRLLSDKLDAAATAADHE